MAGPSNTSCTTSTHWPSVPTAFPLFISFKAATSSAFVNDRLSWSFTSCCAGRYSFQSEPAMLLSVPSKLMK